MIFLGYKSGFAPQVFRSRTIPTQLIHGDAFDYVTGPFKTLRGAWFMAEYGHNNPHCVTVADAERLAKKYPTYCHP